MKDPHEIVKHLSLGDAHKILQILAREDDRLAARIAEMARSLLSDVEPEEVAADLCAELDALEVEEVWDRAGRTRHGYVEPSEAADEMIEEVVEPFLQELHKTTNVV